MAPAWVIYHPPTPWEPAGATPHVPFHQRPGLLGVGMRPAPSPSLGLFPFPLSLPSFPPCSPWIRKQLTIFSWISQEIKVGCQGVPNLF